jgi:hypothetical protein
MFTAEMQPESRGLIENRWVIFDVITNTLAGTFGSEAMISLISFHNGAHVICQPAGSLDSATA